MTITLGVEESSYCSKGKDNRTYSHWEAGAGTHPPVSLPGHAPLCLSDAEQTPSHPGWVMGQYSWTWRTLVSSVMKRWIDVLSFVSITVRLFVGILYIMCICVIFVLHVFKPPVYLFVCECRLRERRGDVYSFVPAGSLSWGSRADLYWGNNPGSGAPAQGGFHSFSRWNFRPHFSTLDDRMQKYDEANLWRRSTNILTYIYCRGWRVGNQFPNYTQTQSHISILLESYILQPLFWVPPTTFLCCLKYSLAHWSYSAVTW